MAHVKLSSWLISAALPAGLLAGTTVAGTVARPHPSRERSAALAARTPLAFEANAGQTDARASFLARGDGYTVFVSPSEAVLKLKGAAKRRGGPFVRPGHEQEVASTPSSVLRIGLVNARKDGPVTGEDELPGTVNYFRRGQHAAASTFRKARCAEVYPGVDVVYYGNQRQLEYDFVVAPGADPDQIRMQLDGARDLTVTAQGNLDIALADGGVSLQKPHVYQDVDGVKQVVESNYRLASNGEVAFELGAYDRERPLVIDPVIIYSTLLGGSGFDSGSAVAFGADGSVFVAGYTESTDFPVTGGTAGGSGDAFVTKYSPDGSEVDFSTYLGGSGTDAARGIGVDSAGRVVVSGTTDSADFPVNGGFQPQLGGKTDAFVVRLSSTGATLEYGTYLGGAEADGGTRLALDADGNIYLTGYTGSADFPHSETAMQPVFAGDYDAFAAKISVLDGSLAFSTYLGGRDGDSGSGIAVDAERSVYIGGSTDSGDFPIGPASFTDTFQGGRFGDAFVTKLAADGASRIYSTYVGGSGSDQGADIAVDLDGFCYITGTTDSNDLMLAAPDILPYQQTLPGGVSDIFVHKILPDGSFIIYTTYLGSAGEDVARAIEVDEDRNPHTKAYVLGETSSPTFPLLDALQSNHGGNSDLFLTKLHENVFLVQPKVVLDYSTFLGGSGLDHAGDLAVDAVGNAAVTGDTVSADFPQHQGPTAARGSGRRSSVQGFVAKVFDGVPEPGGVLQVNQKLSFGNLKVGRSRAKKLILRNLSRTTPLAVTLETPSAPISIGKGVQSVFIKPGGQYTLNVTLSPTASGELNRAVVVRSSDPARPVVNIPVTARSK
jgi:hypothetical protein